MIRKLALLVATAWLGKKAYDALLAVQATSTPSQPESDALPFNPVIDPEIAAALRRSLPEGSEVTDPV